MTRYKEGLNGNYLTSKLINITTDSRDLIFEVSPSVEQTKADPEVTVVDRITGRVSFMSYI